MPATQSHRQIAVSSPLGPDVLLFRRMTATEELGRLFEFDLELLSEDREINPDRLLGQNMTVRLDLPNEDTRYFNGFVSRFMHTGMMEVAAGGRELEYAAYRATLRPWLWFLTRTADCRIFQNKTVKEIVEDVFADHAAIAKFEFKLDRAYRKRVYCVQYRETDFDFVARLLEDEGIAWYFEHKPGEHKLVMTDSTGAHAMAPECDKLPYYANVDQVPPQTDYVSDWNFSRSVETGKTALTSYDFERPSTKLLVLRDRQCRRRHRERLGVRPRPAARRRSRAAGRAGVRRLGRGGLAAGRRLSPDHS